MLRGELQKPEYDGLDDAAVITKLNTKSIKHTDDALYTWAGIALFAGPAAAEMLRVALESNGMGWVVHQFGGAGLQLTNPQVMGALESFIGAGIPLQPLVDEVVWYTSPSEALLGRDAVQADLDALRLEDKQIAASQAGNEVWNQFMTLVNNWDGSGDAPVLVIG